MAFDFEPETAAFVAAVAAGPPTEGLSIDELRDGYRATVIGNSAVVDAEIASLDMDVAGPRGAIAVRLYIPAGLPAPAPLLLYVHGGGFAVGDLESHDRLLRLVAATAKVAVLGLDYARAPEHPFPAARDDVRAVLGWARDQSAALGIDPGRIALGGESAGATHAVMVALAGEAGDLVALWLLVPALDPAGRGASHSEFATGAGRTATEFAYLWSLYLPDAAERAALAPIDADPAGLPPLLVYTAEFDPARDDGEAFAARAEAAGVAVSRHREAGLVHQFPEITGISPGSRAAVEAAARELGATLNGPVVREFKLGMSLKAR